MISQKSSALPEHCRVAEGHVAEEYSEAVSVKYDFGGGEKLFESAYNIKVSTGMKVNLSANNGFILNFHVPTAYTVTVYSDAEMQNEISPAKTDNGYVTYTFKVDLCKTHEIKFYALLAGGTEPNAYSVSLVDYFAEILRDESLGENAHVLAVNAANYCNEIYKFANKGESLAGYQEITKAHAEKIISTDGLLPIDATILNTSVISEAQFMITLGNVPAFAFTKVSSGEVSVKCGEETLPTSEIEVLGTVYYVPVGMSVSDMVSPFEIYVGEEKICDYSIANYIEKTGNSIAKAIYGYGVALKNYIPAV